MKRAKSRIAKSEVTIGMDLGDRRHRYCVLDDDGEVVKESDMSNERENKIATSPLLR